MHKLPSTVLETFVKRRSLLPLAAGALLSARQSGVKLSIGTYGMQGMSVDRALDVIRQIGYDGAELCLMPGWPSEPARLDPSARRRIRLQPLPIASLIENFNLLASDEDHARTLDRIRIAAVLAHEVAPKQPPLLQSVLGGKPGEWEQSKSKMARRLADWARVAEENQLKLVVKSHIGSASDTPGKLVWLLDQVGSAALSGIYDYSHFELLGLDLKASLEELLPRSTLITVKDGKLVDGRPQFLLPGEGSTDYKKYFAMLKAKHYDGWILIEVSRQLQVQSGYDAVEAARRSYSNIAPLLHSAGLRD